MVGPPTPKGAATRLVGAATNEVVELSRVGRGRYHRAVEWGAAPAPAVDGRRAAPATPAPAPPVRSRLLGRHLITELGLQPGPAFGPVLAVAYEAQLDGTVTTVAEALAVVQPLVVDPR